MKSQNEGNQFDKILKEIAEGIFLPFVESHLQIAVKSSRPLLPKLQRTLEREVDFLYELTSVDNEIIILHLEFQSQIEKDLVYRMKEYNAILHRKLNQPVHHIVIYLGVSKERINPDLPLGDRFTGYQIIKLVDVDYKGLLYSEVPEQVVLSLLANVDPSKREEVVLSQIKRLSELSDTPEALSRYMKQLLTLGKLRKIDSFRTKIIIHANVH